MPMPPVSAEVQNLNTIIQTINQNPDKSIVVKNGTFEAVGKFGAFFTSKAKCREATEAFFAGIRAKYGDTVAVTLEPKLSVLRTQGKALDARLARDLITQAGELSSGLKQINSDMARRFIEGSGLRGDTRTLDSALSDYARDNGLAESDKALLKPHIAQMLQKQASQANSLMSFAQFGQQVREGTLPVLQSFAAARGFLQQQGLDTVADSLAAQYGLTGPQKAEIRDLLDKVALNESIQQAKAGKPMTPANVAAAFANSVPVQALLYAWGKNTLLEDAGFAGSAALKEVMSMASSTNHAADLAGVASQIGQGYAPVLLLCLSNMPHMREIQPEGLLTRETIWQACLGEALPAGYAGLSCREMNDKMFDKINERLAGAVGNDPQKLAVAASLLGAGISLEKALEFGQHPIEVNMDCFSGLPMLSTVQSLPGFEECEKSIAKDINRRGTHQSLEGYQPVITFGAGGSEPVRSVHIQDTHELSEEQLHAFKSGNPSPISAELAANVRALCAGNDIQMRQVLLSLGQSGAFPVRSLSAATGVFQDEHSPLDIDVRRLENGDVSLRYRKPENSPLEIDYTYVVRPDGNAVMTDCLMRARPARPEAAAPVQGAPQEV